MSDPTPPQPELDAAWLFSPDLQSRAWGQADSLAAPPTGGFALTLDPGQSKHAVAVLRLAPGASVGLFDGRGTVAQATLEQAHPRQAVLQVQAVQRVAALKPEIQIAAAIPKGPRADSMVAMLAQLGVDRLIPLQTERSVVHPRDGKLERWREVAVEHAKPGRLAWVMQIDPVTPLGPACQVAPGTAMRLADAAGENRVTPPSPETVACRVFVGPEGGFTEPEKQQLHNAGAEAWRFNARTLRIETAAVAAASLLGQARA